jgi:pimeloyl-ACP methyl ester carboxylesterase
LAELFTGPVPETREGRITQWVGMWRELWGEVAFIHGTAGPLIPSDRGEATAALISGARLLLIDGMGHSLPSARWDELVNAILSHTAADDS